MPRQLKSTGQALDLLFALTFDDDNTTLKEFVDPDVNDGMVVDAGVTFGTTTFKGQTRGWFQTTADGAFDFEGISFTSPDQAVGPASSNVSIVMLCAGSGTGNNNKFWISFNGDVHGLGTDGAGKAHITFGGTGCSGTTTIPTDGTTKFFVAGNWSGPSGTEDGEIYYAAEASSDVALENTEDIGSFGSDVPLTHIGGPPGNGNLPFKCIAIYMFDGLRTLSQLQALFDDDLDELFGEAEPGTIADTAARFSGGASNSNPDASIGGAESSRAILTGTGLDGVRNNLFDPITPAQASSGHTDYRCFYLHGDPDGDLATVTLWIHANAANANTTFAIGLDPAGVGGTAATPANETTAPAGVTFSTPSSGSPLSVSGTLTANSKQAVWIRRTVTAGAAFTALDSLTIRASDGSGTKDFVFQHCIQATEARTWTAIGTNTMADQDPCPGNGCSFSGSGGQDAVMTAFNGGVLRQTDTAIDLLVWGGGHGDYAGNEVYRFNVLTKLWAALTSPSTPTGGSEASGKYGDGLPRSTHTYSYLEYDRDNDGMFVAAIPVTFPNAQTSTQAFRFNSSDNTWDTTLPAGGPANPIGGSVGGGDEGVTCYVTGRHQIWYQPASSRDNWALYNTLTDTWGDYQGGSGTHRSVVVACYDSRRHKVYGLGGQGSSNIIVWDLHAGGNHSTQATTGANAATITAATTLGAVYDELLDAVISWNGGQTLHVLNLSTFAWTTLTVSGATPSSPKANGTYGRFRWIRPCSTYPAGGYIVVNDNNEQVYLFAAESAGTVTAAAAGIGPGVGQCVGRLLLNAAAMGIGSSSVHAAGSQLASGIAQACGMGIGAETAVLLVSGTANAAGAGVGQIQASAIVNAIAQGISASSAHTLSAALVAAIAQACGTSAGAFSQLQGLLVTGAAQGIGIGIGTGFAAELLAGSAHGAAVGAAHAREAVVISAAAQAVSASQSAGAPMLLTKADAQAIAIAAGLFSQTTSGIVSGAAIGISDGIGAGTAALVIQARADADAIGIANALAAQLLKAEAQGCGIGTGIPAAALVLGASAEAVAESIGVVLAQSGSQVLQAVRVIYVSRESRTIIVPRDRSQKLN
ncbi:MAG TPA: hypothetical protein VD932_04035 [Aquabacterium sp.]|nr:hypothetical protein [Aquabacterium sp.]